MSFGGLSGRPLGGSFGWGRLPNRAPRMGRSMGLIAAAATSGASYLQRVKGFKGPLNAAATSGMLSSLGDVLAQGLLRYWAEKEGKPPAAFDPLRTLRMFGFGFCWYGPFQYYWYNLLEFLMPVRNVTNFLCKVASNQLLLAPCTLTAVFAWNLTLMNKTDQIKQKIKDDLFPTMQNGWKFWIPAASINFYAIPINLQVLYMSCCGVLWTAYLSYASTTPQTAAGIASESSSKAEAAAKGKKGKK